VNLLRTHIGSTLRSARVEQGRTLRDVAKGARVSLGYLSEVERGQKEASSELLNAICTALELQLSAVIADVFVQLKAAETPTLSVVEDAA
jgi:transcriptional regulator with XRE-family HTH domain